MLVSVIILNYNTLDLTCACIASVQKYTHGVSYEIVVVDNASPADDPEEFLRRFPGSITLIKSVENGGFARGNNLGIAASRGDIILLLNSDAYLNSDSATTAARKLMELPFCGALSVKLTYENGTYQRNARRFRSLRSELLDLGRPFLYLLPYRRRATLMLNQYFRGDFDTPCDWVSGAFFMFRKSILKTLPEEKLDERFFMYGEDQLWCAQFAEHGLQSYFLSSSSAVHIANASTEAGKRRNIRRMGRRHELEIMAYRKGRHSFEYHAFRTLFFTKAFFSDRLKGLAAALRKKV